ncbi:MAG: transporter substrate-binding domain-containing protein, partial [Coriobacteriia bacterium]|nr:transporter substrate-binding domain-containing protein [Coriobacteriia bacterium]
MPSALNALKRLTLAFIIMAMVGALCPLPSFAIERQVIRLGYYDQPGLTEGMGDDQRKSGYAYDYLQRISDYTGWKYEYVYGELPELYEKMDQGEVDMIAGVSPNDKTASKAEFANQPIGKRNCTIYKAQDDDSIAPGFMASFIGKRIGVVEGSSSQTFLKKHLKKNVVSCKVVTFADQDAMVEALANDQIDALTAMDIDVSKVPGITECLTIAQDDFYVCVAPSKRTILRGLNEADAQLRNEDPHFLEQLYSRYYQKEAASVAQSDKEKAWLRVHDQLRIGYLEDYLPFSATDDKGQVTGLLKDYLETLQAQPELESLAMEAVPYTNLHDAYDALQSGEIHVLFPTYQDTWYAEGLDLRESTTVFSQTADLIFTGTYSDATLGTIAICAADTSMEGYAAQFFPNSELLMCDSWEACIDAVKGGRAGSALMNRYKSSQHLQQPGNQALRSTSLSTPCTLSFSVKSTDVELLSLINRGIRLMGTEAIDGAVSRYTYYNFDYSLSSFLAAHIELTILAVVLFVLLLVAAFLYYIRSSKKSQDQLNQAKDQLTEALAQADFANESKTKFLFNMSHDIRTPMNAILGFADLLEKHDDDPQKRHQYTDNIKTAGGYLLDLINEVLEMARIESGKANLNEEPGDYVDMLDAVEVVLSEVSGEKNQTLTKTVSIQHPHIFFDITKERTIFLNVIGNAIKYTPAGGTVEVTVTEQPGPDADTIILESVIKDNGIGMTKDFLPHIFDSF